MKFIVTQHRIRTLREFRTVLVNSSSSSYAEKDAQCDLDTEWERADERVEKLPSQISEGIEMKIDKDYQ